MAVEAHHLHLFSPQLLMNRDLAKFTESQAPAMLGNTQTGVVPAPLLASSESGVTISGKKRAREPLSFLGEDLSSYFQQQMLDVDRLVLHHAERMRLELTERRRRFSRQLVAAIEDAVSKRLRAREDEIERLKKLNWAMEERIRTLTVENEIWKELAQTNEATANLLRTNLEQLLAAQIRIKEEQRLVDEASPANDAESCCCGGGNDDRDTSTAAATGLVRACRSCRERETTVLILPCRHLCLCAACAPIIKFCPVCNCPNTGTVNVNLS
ncbi:hypothetical protein IEQ34_012082 [Dendrobium chrysotoxum]|uniref:RING-type domain-containing protein n=1 Tax=Dendrobium chrysotoxum TaxID=161865 RepID=A0AAV7GU86_DENCH|nr:hypothetical protein IEQ34_012082 [Dendrobium chrysotoxum]